MGEPLHIRRFSVYLAVISRESHIFPSLVNGLRKWGTLTPDRLPLALRAPTPEIALMS